MSEEIRAAADRLLTEVRLYEATQSTEPLGSEFAADIKLVAERIVAALEQAERYRAQIDNYVRLYERVRDNPNEDVHSLGTVAYIAFKSVLVRDAASSGASRPTTTYDIETGCSTCGCPTIMDDHCWGCKRVIVERITDAASSGAVVREFRPEDYREPDDPDDTASIQRAINAAAEHRAAQEPAAPQQPTTTTGSEGP